jgi:hypothetical protein
MRRRLFIAIVSLTALLFLLIRASGGAMCNPFLSFENLGTWVAAAFTLFALSFLYGDNPFFRLTEHIFVGVTAAYWMVTGFWRTIVPKLLGNVVPEIPVFLFGVDTPLDVSLARRLLYCLPLLLGLLLLARLNPRGRILSTLSLAFIVGTTAGLRLMGHLDANFLGQIQNSIVSWVSLKGPGFDLGRTLEALILTSGTICCLLYFYFSRQETGPLGQAGRIGLWIPDGYLWCQFRVYGHGTDCFAGGPGGISAARLVRAHLKARRFSYGQRPVTVSIPAEKGTRSFAGRSLDLLAPHHYLQIRPVLESSDDFFLWGGL